MQQVYHSDGNLLDMSFPLNAGDQIALDDAFQRLLKQNGIANGLPFSLSSALTSSGGSVTPSAVIAALAGQDAGVQSLTITNPNDATTVILDMNFGGAGYLTIRPQGLPDGTGGLDVFGEIFAGGGGLFVNSADPDSGIVGGSFGWTSGQALNEGATGGGSLSTQYISTVSNFEIGYTGSAVAARKFYVEAGTGNVTSVGSIKSTMATASVAGRVANFDATGNPATSSPALANFDKALELGGVASSDIPGNSAMYLGSMTALTQGNVVTVMNNYGAVLGGSEVHCVDFKYNGDILAGGNIELGHLGSAGRVTSFTGNLYLTAPDTLIQYNTGSTDIVNWYTGAGTLKGKLTAAGDMLLAGKLGVGNSAAASVAVGTLVKKIEVFDASGASLGFIPVYSSIT